MHLRDAHQVWPKSLLDPFKLWSQMILNFIRFVAMFHKILYFINFDDSFDFGSHIIYINRAKYFFIQ